MATFTMETERNGSDELVVRCHFPAPREKVFRAWTEPKWLAQWMCPASGTGATVDKFDLMVGGGFQLTMHFEDGKETVTGEYLEIRPHDRLVLTWQWLTNDATPEPTEITVELTEAGDGCEMTMTHSRFVSAEVRDKHIEGWQSCVGQLNNFVGKE